MTSGAADEIVDCQPHGQSKIKDPGLVSLPRISGPWSVDKVLATLPSGSAPPEATSTPLPYFHMLERLKTMKREGWRRFGIERGESIADHMYRMAMISMVPPASLKDRIDIARCTKMCLIHDMAESLVGDITPVDGVPKAEKSRRESTTIDYFSQRLLGNVLAGTAGQELKAIWWEYENSETLESKYVHDIDKLELLLQMVEYERRGEGGLDLGEFAYVATKMNLPEMKEWAQDVLREREQFWGSKKHLHGETKGEINTETVKGQDEYYDGEGQS